MKPQLMTRILAKKRIPLIFSTFLLITISSAHAEIYKWVDKDGQTHYSETPPAEQLNNAENIEEAINLAKGKSSPLAEQNEKSASTSDDDTHPQNNYCQKQREALEVLQANDFVKWQQNGKEEILEGDTKQKKTDEIKLEIDKFCQGVESNNTSSSEQNKTD
jgi:hypothetical protein